MKKGTILLTIILMGAGSVSGQLDKLLQNYIDLRFAMFLHFNMNTFYPGWGNQRVDPKTFNPAKLDCSQWAKAAKAAGMKYAILTVKHHDGFCLWPSKAMPPNGLGLYTVAQSSIPSRDVVKEYVDAFRAEGLLPGIYYSIWDVGNGVCEAGGSWEKERPFVLGQLSELLGGTYGKFVVFMTDAWEWKLGHRRVPYPEVREHIKKLQPDIILQNCCGCGSNWECDIICYEANQGGTNQIPAGNTMASTQCYMISSDWFWNSTAADSTKLKTLSLLLTWLTTNSESRWGNFILNCPPNRDGLIDDAIVTRITQIGKNWRPDTTRPLLPPQIPQIEYPVMSKSCTVSSNASGSIADYAIDGVMSLNPQGVEHNLCRLWKSANSLPAWIMVDMGRVYYNMDIFGVLPHRSPTDRSGAVTSYSLLAGTDSTKLAEVASGTWDGKDYHYKTIGFPPTAVRYFRFVIKATSNAAGNGAGTYAYLNELNMGGRTQKPDTLPVSVVNHLSVQQEPQNGVLLSRALIKSGRLQIRFRLQEESRMKISLFDCAGRNIGRLPEKKVEQGMHTVSSAVMASGVCFIHFEAAPVETAGGIASEKKVTIERFVILK